MLSVSQVKRYPSGGSVANHNPRARVNSHPDEFVTSIEMHQGDLCLGTAWSRSRWTRLAELESHFRGIV